MQLFTPSSQLVESLEFLKMNLEHFKPGLGDAEIIALERRLAIFGRDFNAFVEDIKLGKVSTEERLLIRGRAQETANAFKNAKQRLERDTSPKDARLRASLLDLLEINSNTFTELVSYPVSNS